MAFSPNGGGYRSGRRGNPAISEINVTPFVDVVLVLLIIFMLTAHVLEFGIEVDVPKVRTIKENAQDMPVVTITKDGVIKLNADDVNINNLPATIRQKFGKAKGVYVRADKETIWDPIAQVTAEELKVQITTTSGPVLQKKLDLTGILSNIRLHQVFFIDEVHRLLPDVEEMLYSALEDFRVDILVGVGPGARTHSLPMPKFTAIGATTRQGLVSAPLRGRFGLVLRLDPYAVEDLKAIVKRSARLLAVDIEDGAEEELARRCRGTPRIANRLLRRVRDYAQVRADGRITLPVAQTALNLLDVDRYGLDEIDQKIMRTVLEKYGGGPVGVNTIAASISEEADTVEEVYEPCFSSTVF